MSKFKKKPVIIEAFKYNNNWTELCAWVNKLTPNNNTTLFYKGPPGDIIVKTLEGEMSAVNGDWIICGVKGEYYPCRSDIFEQTYELVEE